MYIILEVTDRPIFGTMAEYTIENAVYEFGEVISTH